MTEHDSSKRRFIKAATYIAPVILTLKVAPTYASGGSGRNGYPDEPRDEQDHGNQGNGGHRLAPRKKRRWYWPFS